MESLVLSVTDFVALCNQTLEFAYPNLTIEGEISNFRVSKNQWVYFDIKDEMSSLRCFGLVYRLPGPLEDGMIVRITGFPKLHPQYGFSINWNVIQPVGEGALKRASELLKAKLTKEGLFDETRKRSLPYPPEKVGLITSKGQAAYHDFFKVLDARFGGLEILSIDVHVQGRQAQPDIVNAIRLMNELPEPPEVLIVTRGGGSPDDLAAFDNEQVVRAVAGSRIPTLVAVGHEVDVTLAELAADRRASTPSNAAELLVPDKQDLLKRLSELQKYSGRALADLYESEGQNLKQTAELLQKILADMFAKHETDLNFKKSVAKALDPAAALKRGYAVLRSGNNAIKSIKFVKLGSQVNAQLYDGKFEATVDKIS